MYLSTWDGSRRSTTPIERLRLPCYRPAVRETIANVTWNTLDNSAVGAYESVTQVPLYRRVVLMDGNGRKRYRPRMPGFRADPADRRGGATARLIPIVISFRWTGAERNARPLRNVYTVDGWRRSGLRPWSFQNISGKSGSLLSERRSHEKIIPCDSVTDVGGVE